MAVQHTCQKCGQKFGKIFSLTIHKIVIHNQPKIKLERIDDHKLNVSSNDGKKTSGRKKRGSNDKMDG